MTPSKYLQLRIRQPENNIPANAEPSNSQVQAGLFYSKVKREDGLHTKS